MHADLLYEAIGDIRDDLILDAEQNPAQIRRSILKPLLAACFAVFLLAIPVSAELTTGYVSNLLAPLYGGAQTELVDSIGVPIGASATAGGYTLTADAVIGDRYHIAVVYTLTRNDGSRIQEGTRFASHDRSLRSGSGGGYLHYELSEDGTELRIIDQWTSSGRLFFLKRNATVTFQDLLLDQGDGTEDIPLAQGTWELEFTVRYKDTTVEIPVDDPKVSDSGGNQYQIRKIMLSPIGVHVDITAPNPHMDNAKNASLYPNFSASVVLSDGTVIELKDRNIAANGKSDSATFNADFGAMFDEPIPLEEIKALVICDTTFPVELTE